MQPYQGIVELKEGLAQSLSSYFKSSEQLLTSFVLKCLTEKAQVYFTKLPTNEDTSSLNDDFDDAWNTSTS